MKPSTLAYPCCLLLACSVIGLASFWTPTTPADDKTPTGTVTFSEHLIRDKYGYAYGIAVADLNGDRLPDITSADADKGDLHWLVNKGQGKFEDHPIKQAEAGWFERHVIGDVNGDGKPDVLVVKNLVGDLVWFENPGSPDLSAPWKRHVIATKFMRSYDVALADLDGDGKPDVIASAWIGNKFAWFKNPGNTNGEWERHTIDDNAPEARAIHAVDLNGDGKLDLIGTARTGNLVAWYENPGPPFTQKWKRHVIDDKTIFPTHGHPVDMDGDGDMDVVMAAGFHSAPPGSVSNQIIWYENVGSPGKGTEWKKHVIGELTDAFEAVAGDLNGDGKPDVAATAWGPKGQVVWFENPGDPRGKWVKHILKANWVRANQILLADLDNDGRLDILAAAERGTNELRWWRNEGKKK